jgi:hypothetical protein
MFNQFGFDYYTPPSAVPAAPTSPQLDWQKPLEFIQNGNRLPARVVSRNRCNINNQPNVILVKRHTGNEDTFYVNDSGYCSNGHLANVVEKKKIWTVTFDDYGKIWSTTYTNDPYYKPGQKTSLGTVLHVASFEAN